MSLLAKKDSEGDSTAMFRSYEYGCARFKPTIRCVCVFLSSLLLVVDCSLTFFEYFEYRSTDNPLAAAMTGVFFWHSLITLLYLVGAMRRIACCMMSWLTVQLIFVTIFAIVLIVWWIATVLAFFNIVQSPYPRSNSLSNGEFFVLAGCFLTLVFILTAKLSLIFYKGFVDVRKQNLVHSRISEAIERKSSRTFPKPSYV